MTPLIFDAHGTTPSKVSKASPGLTPIRGVSAGKGSEGEGGFPRVPMTHPAP